MIQESRQYWGSSSPNQDNGIQPSIISIQTHGLESEYMYLYPLSHKPHKLKGLKTMAGQGETVRTGAPETVNGKPLIGPQVMHSYAGWYIGYGYIDSEFGCEMPYSRESGYYRTEEDAIKDLQDYIDTAHDEHLPGARDDKYHPGELTLSAD